MGVPWTWPQCPLALSDELTTVATDGRHLLGLVKFSQLQKEGLSSDILTGCGSHCHTLAAAIAV